MTIFPFELKDILQGAIWFLLGAVVSYILSHRKALYAHIQYRAFKYSNETQARGRIKAVEEEINILIWNGGNTVVSGNDVSVKHPVLVSSSRKFNKTISILNSSPHIEAAAQRVDSHKLKIIFDFLNPGDAFEVRARVSGERDIGSSLRCSASIKGLSKGIKKFKNTPYADSIFLLTIMIPTLVLVAATAVQLVPGFWKFCVDFFDGNLMVAGRNIPLEEYIPLAIVIVIAVPFLSVGFLAIIATVTMALQNLAGIPRFVQERALEFNPPPDLPHGGIL